jgi:hypothetical protein
MPPPGPKPCVLLGLRHWIAAFAPESSSNRTGHSPADRHVGDDEQTRRRLPSGVASSRIRGPFTAAHIVAELIETGQAVCIIDLQVEVFEEIVPRMPWRWRSAESKFSRSENEHLFGWQKRGCRPSISRLGLRKQTDEIRRLRPGPRSEYEDEAPRRERDRSSCSGCRYPTGSCRGRCD